MDVRKHFFRERNSRNMKCNTMCLLRKKMIIKHITECSEKWSDYYSCKQREDEENSKGHLTKLQEAVHVDNLRKIIFDLRNS